MTYGTPTSCRFGAPSIPLASTEDRDTGWRGSEDALALAWARQAAKEGHRKAIPPDPVPKLGGRPPSSGRPRQPMPAALKVMRALLRRDALSRNDLGDATRVYGAAMSSVLASLLAEGLVRVTATPTEFHPNLAAYSLTDAGRARLEAQP